MKQTLASTISKMKRAMDVQVVKYQSLTEKLVKEVGTGGETFATRDGTVQVTQETQGRNGDGFNYSYSQEAYDLLPKKIQDLLATTGVVTLKRKVIKGTSPKVVVRLK